MKLGGFQLIPPTWGATLCGVTKKCCAFFRPKVVCGLEAGELRVQAGGGPDQGARIRGSSAHMPGFLSPRHPPSTWAWSAAETNGRDNTQLDAIRSCPARGVICERMRAPADQEMWRRPAIRERAAGVRLRLRAFCALWDAARASVVVSGRDSRCIGAKQANSRLCTQSGTQAMASDH